jgi:cytidylate kinase
MQPRVVTISASFGAGGSVIGPAVAERLELPFLDRAIPAAVAQQLDVPLEEALAQDEQPPSRLERLLGVFAQAATPLAPEAMPVDSNETFLARTEEVMRTAARETGGVLLGRAGMVVLRDYAGALHVRLDGPRDARARQGRRIESLDEEEVQHRLGVTDRARETYVRHFYRTDPTDCDLFHLVLDSTTLTLDVCVEIIVAASNDLSRTYGGG